MSRYIIAGQEPGTFWGHIFVGKREVMTRFAYDAEDERLVGAQIQWNANGDFVDASREEMADLEDSLKNANPDALSAPHEWNLGVADVLPDWCSLEAAHRP